MDVLYILGKGSLFGNDELRYSLRSLENNVSNVGRVIVVGEDPGFLSDEVEYHYIEEGFGNKEWRIGAKILEACDRGIVKRNFFFVNDDHFFIQPTKTTRYPNYCKGNLINPKIVGTYQRALNDTAAYLLALGKTALHFDVHTPIVYNPKKFKELREAIAKSKKARHGYVVKSLYGNIHKLKPTAYVDKKLQILRGGYDDPQIKDGHVISCSDRGWKYGVGDFVKELFPNKSKYEK